MPLNSDLLSCCHSGNHTIIMIAYGCVTECVTVSYGIIAYIGFPEGPYTSGTSALHTVPVVLQLIYNPQFPRLTGCEDTPLPTASFSVLCIPTVAVLFVEQADCLAVPYGDITRLHVLRGLSAMTQWCAHLG